MFSCTPERIVALAQQLGTSELSMGLALKAVEPMVRALVLRRLDDASDREFVLRKLEWLDGLNDPAQAALLLRALAGEQEQALVHALAAFAGMGAHPARALLYQEAGPEVLMQVAHRWRSGMEPENERSEILLLLPPAVGRVLLIHPFRIDPLADEAYLPAEGWEWWLLLLAFLGATALLTSVLR